MSEDISMAYVFAALFLETHPLSWQQLVDNQTWCSVCCSLVLMCHVQGKRSEQHCIMPHGLAICPQCLYYLHVELISRGAMCMGESWAGLFMPIYKQ